MSLLERALDSFKDFGSFLLADALPALLAAALFVGGLGALILGLIYWVTTA